jgi:hypothetical protein
MKKRTFFLTSVPLATGALVAQAAAFYYILLAVADATGRFYEQIYFHPVFVQEVPPAPVVGFYWIVSVFLWGGLALAVFSLASVVASFRSRERGWRFIPATLLVLYFASWMPLLFRNYL